VAELDGVVAIVSDADAVHGAAVARTLAASGTRVIVVCGSDGGALGSLAADLRADGCRVGMFLGDPTVEGADLVEMVRELWLARAETRGETGGSGPEGDR
jgi:hypothetical protein